MTTLQNKVAVVTGGNSGIGLATAQRFIEEGAKVVVFGRNRETLEQAVRALGPNAHGVQGDVTSHDDLARLFAETEAKFGKLDVLFANAGVAEFATIDQVDETHFDKLFDINVKGSYFTIAASLPHLNDGASIIVTTSVVNEMGLPSTSVYSATKAALRSLARTLSAELAPRGIRVNALAPGLTETPLFGKMGLKQDEIEAFGADVLAKTPAARLGRPQDQADAALFLASPNSAYVVGTEIAVDGGLAQI